MTFNVMLEKRKRKEILQRKVKAEGLPPVLTDVDSLYSAPTQPIQLEEFEVSTDSGAHTLYKKYFVVGDKASAQARLNADYSYIQTKEFKLFLDTYIEHLHQYKHLYRFYVTLDIINNPAESWKITEYMESCGLSPMPVFHNGEEIYWLERMVEKYEYIGISGLGQDITKSKFQLFGDSVFKVVCDKNGKPKCKIHGFAMGTPEIIKQYPWYSMDQSTWTHMSRVGSLLVPKPIHKNKELLGYDFLNMYKVIPVTNRRDVEGMHINNLGALALHFTKEYLKLNGIDLDAVRESYHWRDVANIRLFHNMQKAAKEWYKEKFDFEEGANIYLAGTAAGAGCNKSRLIKLHHDLNIPVVRWLTTPVYQNHAINILELLTAWKKGIDWRTLWDANLADKVRRDRWGMAVKTKSEKVPKKELVVSKPKIARRPIIQLTGLVELEHTITIKRKTIVDASAYQVATLKQLVDKELKYAVKTSIPPTDCEHFIQVTATHQQNTESVSHVEQPRKIQSKESDYGFF